MNQQNSQQGQSYFPSQQDYPPVSPYPSQQSAPQQQAYIAQPQPVPPVQPAPLDLLLASYTPDQRNTIKAQNLAKYNIPHNSPLYQYPTAFMDKLVNEHPEDFPESLREDMKGSLGRIRRDYNIFHTLTFGGMFYWLFFKNLSWFRLTGNGIMRLAFVFTNFNQMISYGYTEIDYITQKVYSNASYFQNAINKVQPDPNTPRAELL